MLNSIIELDQKELSLISGGEDTLNTASDNSLVIDVQQSHSYSEQALKAAWYVSEAVGLVAGVVAGAVVVATGIGFIIKYRSRNLKK